MSKFRPFVQRGLLKIKLTKYLLWLHPAGYKTQRKEVTLPEAAVLITEIRTGLTSSIFMIYLDNEAMEVSPKRKARDNHRLTNFAKENEKLTDALEKVNSQIEKLDIKIDKLTCERKSKMQDREWLQHKLETLEKEESQNKVLHRVSETINTTASGEQMDLN